MLFPKVGLCSSLRKAGQLASLCLTQTYCCSHISKSPPSRSTDVISDIELLTADAKQLFLHHRVGVWTDTLQAFQGLTFRKHCPCAIQRWIDLQSQTTPLELSTKGWRLETEAFILVECFLYLIKSSTHQKFDKLH